MQENALHGWRLPDGHHMRMTGYPANPIAVFHQDRQVAGNLGGPTPSCCGRSSPAARWANAVANSPAATASSAPWSPPTLQHEAVAAGFSDGLVVIAEIASARILPICGPGRGPVSALAWSGEGGHLAFGTETGFAGLVDLSKAG